MGKIVRVVNLFERYSIAKPDCASDFKGNCENYMYDFSRFDKGESFVDSRPILLLMGGMHGDEVTGTNSLYNLIKLFLREADSNSYL